MRGEILREPLVILTVGFSGDLVSDLLRAHPQNRVLVIEEADLIQSIDASWTANSRVSVRPGAYQQNLEAVAVGAEWFENDPFHAVIAGREYGVRAVHLMAERLGLPGVGSTAAELSTDKLAMRTTAARLGLTTGRFAPVGSPAEIRAFMGDGPVVLKPRSRHASLGVVRIDTAAEIDSAWDQAVSSHQQGGVTRLRPMRWDYMVEDFVAGRGEFSIESLVRDGAVVFSNVTQKKMNASGHFSPLGHVLPADIPRGLAEELRNAERRLLTGVAMADGISHSEWIWTSAGLHLVECAFRFPGGGLGRLIESVYQVNLAGALVRLLAGETAVVAAPPHGVGAVHFLTGGDGRLVSVDGADFLEAVDWVTEYRVWVPADGQISRVRNSLDRIGYVMVRADTHAELDERLREVAAKVTIAIRG